MEPFKANYRKAFNGLCLAIIQSKEKTGQVLLKATSPGLKSAEMTIKVKR
jgi:beta-galactosidase